MTPLVKGGIAASPASPPYKNSPERDPSRKRRMPRSGCSKQKPKLIPRPRRGIYTRPMSQEPATAISDMKRDPRRMIGLFLVRLFQYLLRRQASGQTLVPNDKASLVGSAEFMVNGYIRTLAVKQSCRVGCSPPTIITAGQGPPYFWPPPLLDPWPPPGKAAEIKDHNINSFPGARRRIRDPETKLAHYSFAAVTSDRAGAAPLRRSRRNGASKLNQKRGRDSSAATNAHLFCCLF